MGRASFSVNQSCASSGLEEGVGQEGYRFNDKPPPSTKRQPPHCNRRRDACRRHWFQVCLVVGGKKKKKREAGVSLLRSERSHKVVTLVSSLSIEIY